MGGTHAHRQYAALPWRRNRLGDLQVLLVTSRERGRWLLPKGWPMGDKLPERVAAQEAFEEAGVIGDADPVSIGSYDYLKLRRDGSSVDCTVTIYPLLVRGTLVEWPERAQRRRRWYDLSEACWAVPEEGLAQFLAGLRGRPGLLQRASSDGSGAGAASSASARSR